MPLFRVQQPATEQEKEEVKVALRALREVVTEAGEFYVYPVGKAIGVPGGCAYVRQGEPDCIVARTLVKLGATVESLIPWEGKSCDFMPSVHAAWRNHYPVAPVPMGMPAYNVLRWAQTMQDRGETWGVSLRAAEREAEVSYGVVLESV